MLQATIIVRITDSISEHRFSRHLDIPTLPFVGMKLDLSRSGEPQGDAYISLIEQAYLPVSLLEIRRVVYSVYGQALTLYGIWRVGSTERLAPTLDLYERFFGFQKLGEDTKLESRRNSFEQASMIKTDLFVDVSDGVNAVTSKFLWRQLMLPFIPFEGIKLDFTPTEIEDVGRYAELKQQIGAPVELVDIESVTFIVSQNQLHLSGETKTGNPDRIEATLELYKRYYGFPDY